MPTFMPPLRTITYGLNASLPVFLSTRFEEMNGVFDFAAASFSLS